MLQDFQEVEESVGKENVMYVRYEDLLDTGKRKGELKKLVRFLGVEGEEEEETQTHAHAHTHKDMGGKGKGEEERRLECAFILADRPETHRGSGGGADTHTQGKVVEGKGKKKKKLSKEDVYGPKLLCAMWGLLEEEEDMLIEHGYGPEKLPFGLKCD
jgi:hypothetical protein